MTPEVQDILSCYESESPGVLTNLSRIMNHGRLAGTGKMVILPVDQGFEHGPLRSFAMNPKAYDPYYHFELAIESGCNAYAAPYGFLQAGAVHFAGEVPLILKINNSDSLFKDKGGPVSALTSYVEEALKLGCVGIGFTIYPGSSASKEMYEEITKAARQARKSGLVVVIWSYPRGGTLSKKGETAVDIVSYAAQIAAQLGAHIIKVKPPTAHIELKDNQTVIDKNNILIDSLKERVELILKSTFNGKRIVIFSGGEAKSEEDVLNEIKEIAAGGGFGSIVGRNAFQRPKKDAIHLLNNIMDIYAGKS